MSSNAHNIWYKENTNIIIMTRTIYMLIGLIIKFQKFLRKLLEFQGQKNECHI